jgi:hypothetical protein
LAKGRRQADDLPEKDERIIRVKMLKRETRRCTYELDHDAGRTSLDSHRRREFLMDLGSGPEGEAK